MNLHAIKHNNTLASSSDVSLQQCELSSHFASISTEITMNSLWHFRGKRDRAVHTSLGNVPTLIPQETKWVPGGSWKQSECSEARWLTCILMMQVPSCSTMHRDTLDMFSVFLADNVSCSAYNRVINALCMQISTVYLDQGKWVRACIYLYLLNFLKQLFVVYCNFLINKFNNFSLSSKFEAIFFFKSKHF